MNKRNRTTAFLCLLLCLFLPFSAPAEGEDPVVVRVGEVAFPLSLARYSYQSSIDLLAYQGVTPTQEEKQELLTQTVDHLVELGLIENKLMEAGLNDLTEEEESALRSYAGNVYESLWQGLSQRAKDAGVEATEKEITGWLAEQGYTLDLVYEEALVALRNERILALYCPDVTVTPEEVEAYYLETFLEPDRAAYAHDIPRYEQEILDTGNESFYTPEGYRVIRQILLPFPSSVLSQLNPLSQELEEASAAVDAAYNAAADAAVSGGDVEAARGEYKAKQEALSAVAARINEAQESALPLVKDRTDEIARKYREGVSFDDLAKEYGQEAGEEAAAELLFHPDSTRWAENFRKHVLALEKPGDLSEPFITNLGIHMVLYQADWPGGEHVLSEEERQALEAGALQAKQTKALRLLEEDWKKQYPIETHPELLVP